MDNFLKECKQAQGHENDRTLEYYKKILNSNSIEIKDIKPIFFFMNTPVDKERIDNKIVKFMIKAMWRINKQANWYFKKMGTIGKGMSYFWALILYSFDRLILHFTSVGPSTKLLVAGLTQQTETQ